MTTLEGLAKKLDSIAEAIARLERTAPPPDQPELLTPKAAAAALSVCTKTLRAMIRRGQIRTVPVGKAYRIPASEVRRYATPKTAAPRRKRRAAEPYDARAEYERTMKRLGGRR
jgi:excisionase family DNA binding protein